jgi:hypothetical protein
MSAPGVFDGFSYARFPALLVRLRIPTQSGRGFRFEAGHRSDLIPATIPI